MKLSRAFDFAKQQYWEEARIQRNPSDEREYFALLIGNDGKTFVLVSEDEQPYTSAKIEYFVDLLKSIGFREFTVAI